MSAIATPPFALDAPPARRKRRAGEGRPAWKTIVIVTAAYLIAFVFVVGHAARGSTRWISLGFLPKSMLQ